MRALFSVLILSLAACGAPQQAADHPAGEQSPAMRMQVLDTWASPTPGGVDVSAGYLTIANEGENGDRLITALSPRATRVEIHEMTMDGAVMQMRQVTALEIPAGERIEFAPGGRHLMFIGVTQPFTEGEEIPVQLTFENAGVMDIALPVRTGVAQGQH